MSSIRELAQSLIDNPDDPIVRGKMVKMLMRSLTQRLSRVEILSADGGGIRGYLQMLLIARIAKLVPGFLAKPKVLTGASIGGINMLGLAAGLSLAQMLDIYESRAVDIFKDRGALDRFIPDEMWRADFDRADLDGVLEDVFGDITMDELQRDVLIPVFDLRSWNTKFYDRSDNGVLVRDVAGMTSAAPTFWATKLWSLDGGLFANNPADCAIAATIKRLRGEGSADYTLGGRISCLSIGTGEVPHLAPSEEPEWDAGLKDMMPLLLDIVFDGGVKASTFRAEQALNGRFFRLQPKLPSAINLADVGKLDELKQIANLTPLDGTLAWCKDVWGLGAAT